MRKPRILIFDVETTGTDKKRDQVIEFCAQFGLEESSESRTWRIRPSVEIQPGAQEVHGISMEDLAGAPTFAEVADELRGIFDGVQMLVGYNLRFDIDMLQAEFQRLGQPPIDLSETFVVDPYRLWQRCEPRSLMDAHKRFVGGEFEAAHSASADVAATGRVLLGMVESFGLGTNWEEVADICEPERANWLGGTHHLQWNESGEVIMAFGKHSGVPLHSIAQGGDAGYLRWLISKDFPQHVGDICTQALSLGAAEFATWVEGAYPRKASIDQSPIAKAESQAAAESVPTPKPGQQSLF